MFLACSSFVFSAFTLKNKQTNKGWLGWMVILFKISPHFGSLSVSLPAEPHSILTTTNLTAQNMSQCKLSWGGNGSEEDVTIRPVYSQVFSCCSLE